jgi:hypothetical protein
MSICTMATLLPVHRAAIVNLYSALFNRAPDASGLAFWAQAYADGASLVAITQSFVGTPEGRSTYPTGQTSAQFVAAFYQAVFGRAVDASGLAFWVASLDAAGGAGSDAARATLAGQIVAIVSQPLSVKPDGLSDAAYAQTVADRALFANKAVVGDYVASININDVTLAKQVLALVTADPASVPVAKAFAANGGVVPVPPEPTFTIVTGGSATDIAARFAAYTGSNATVDVTGLDASKLAAVAAAIAKIGSGGISGVLTLDVAGYGSTDVATIATKLAMGATLTVTGGAGGDIIDLREFQRATTLDGGDGGDTFNAVVDAATPANTTLSANHTIIGGAGTDSLRLLGVKGTVADVLNGAHVSGIEYLSVTQAGGSATVSANAELLQIGVAGNGDFTANNMGNTTLVLDGTASTGSYTLNTIGTAANLILINGAQANVVTEGGTATSFSVSKSGAASLITSLKLGDAINQMYIAGNGDIAITGLTGNLAGGLAITVSGTGLAAMNSIDSPVTSLNASAATNIVLAVFNQSVQTVVGGSGNDIFSISATSAAGGSTLTGGAGSDVFVLRAGVGLTAAPDNAALLAKLVTITDFSVGDQLEIEATPTITGSGSVQVVPVAAPSSLLDAATQAVAGGGAKPYLGFVYQAASYLLVDGAGNGLGAGDVLVKLTGVNLANVSYTDGNLTTV